MNYKRLAKVLRHAETTEDEFHKLLDQNPEDHTTRLVLADWLQEHDDPRAEGYRALGILRRRPNPMSVSGNKQHFFGNKEADHFGDNLTTYEHTMLPKDWFMLLNPEPDSIPPDFIRAWKHFDNRKDAEDTAALAFSKLPPERREQILRGEG